MTSAISLQTIYDLLISLKKFNEMTANYIVNTDPTTLASVSTEMAKSQMLLSTDSSVDQMPESFIYVVLEASKELFTHLFSLYGVVNDDQDTSSNNGNNRRRHLIIPASQYRMAAQFILKDMIIYLLTLRALEVSLSQIIKNKQNEYASVLKSFYSKNVVSSASSSSSSSSSVTQAQRKDTLNFLFYMDRQADVNVNCRIFDQRSKKQINKGDLKTMYTLYRMSNSKFEQFYERSREAMSLLHEKINTIINKYNERHPFTLQKGPVRDIIDPPGNPGPSQFEWAINHSIISSSSTAANNKKSSRGDLLMNLFGTTTGEHCSSSLHGGGGVGDDEYGSLNSEISLFETNLSKDNRIDPLIGDMKLLDRSDKENIKVVTDVLDELNKSITKQFFELNLIEDDVHKPLVITRIHEILNEYLSNLSNIVSVILNKQKLAGIENSIEIINRNLNNPDQKSGIQSIMNFLNGGLEGATFLISSVPLVSALMNKMQESIESIRMSYSIVYELETSLYVLFNSVYDPYISSFFHMIQTQTSVVYNSMPLDLVKFVNNAYLLDGGTHYREIYTRIYDYIHSFSNPIYQLALNGFNINSLESIALRLAPNNLFSNDEFAQKHANYYKKCVESYLDWASKFALLLAKHDYTPSNTVRKGREKDYKYVAAESELKEQPNKYYACLSTFTITADASTNQTYSVPFILQNYINQIECLLVMDLIDNLIRRPINSVGTVNRLSPNVVQVLQILSDMPSYKSSSASLSMSSPSSKVIEEIDTEMCPVMNMLLYERILVSCLALSANKNLKNLTDQLCHVELNEPELKIHLAGLLTNKPKMIQQLANHSNIHINSKGVILNKNVMNSGGVGENTPNLTIRDEFFKKIANGEEVSSIEEFIEIKPQDVMNDQTASMFSTATTSPRVNTLITPFDSIVLLQTCTSKPTAILHSAHVDNGLYSFRRSTFGAPVLNKFQFDLL